jgi:hypothetical protein
MTTSSAVARSMPVRHRWLPRQHGGWAMLLLPLLLGVAASRPDPWQLVLAAAAVGAYVSSATIQAWARARRPAAYRAPIVVWGAMFAVSGLPLLATFPSLLLSAVVIVPAAAITLAGARPGRRRDLVNSLAQVAQALVLVPAGALVSGAFDVPAVATATAVAATYLVGTVLVVRSVLSERGNRTFAAVSAGFHAAALIGALIVLPLAYAVVAAWLTARAIGLPVVQQRLAGTRRPLRPIHVGIVEMVSSMAVIAVSFAVPV